MQAASRPYALAAAALAAVSAVVVTPVVARQLPLAVRSMETKLVDADVANIPVNLFDDILNIPYNELEGGGLATVANSFLFTGTWWVPSSTNLWGIDPGDPTHIALIDNFLPFTAFTEGFTNSAGVYEPGLNYEFAGLLAAELPVSSSCDADQLLPDDPAGGHHRQHPIRPGYRVLRGPHGESHGRERRALRAVHATSSRCRCRT